MFHFFVFSSIVQFLNHPLSVQTLAFNFQLSSQIYIFIYTLAVLINTHTIMCTFYSIIIKFLYLCRRILKLMISCIYISITHCKIKNIYYDYILFLHRFFFFLAAPHSLWDLRSPARDWTHSCGSESADRILTTELSENSQWLHSFKFF